MKKPIVAAIGVLVLVALALAIIPTTRDEIHWRWASHKDEMITYESYLKAWPEGRHVVEARTRYDEHGWVRAKTANTVQGFERYVQLHAAGKHIAEARDKIQSFHWQEATTANTVQGFERYVQLHGGSEHVAEARGTIESFHWQEATTANTIEGFERYVHLHGTGKHVAEAMGKSESLHRQKAFAGLNDAILAKLNNEPSSVVSLGSRTGRFTKGLVSGSFTIHNRRPVVDAGSKVVYGFDNGAIKVLGTAGENGSLASIDKVTFARGAEITFKSGEHYVHDGREWTRRN